LIFIEVTISGIRHNTMLTANFDKIEKEIKQIFFSAENRKSKGKVVQLNGAINSFKKGELNSLGIDPSTIRRIYPILVLQKGIPTIPVVFARYCGWIRKKRFIRGYLDNFLIIDLEELEMIESIVSQGVQLPDILEQYKSSEYKGWPFKNFLCFEWKSVPRNQFLDSQLSKMFKDVEKYFSRGGRLKKKKRRIKM